MSIPKPTFSKYIKEFKLKELFNELGWDNAHVKYPIKADEKLYSLTGIAQKKDFLILLCEPQDGGYIPDSAARKKIDNAITKLHYEHLIVYIDDKKTRQHWELMVREQNKPIVCRPIDYYAGQEPELLFQKLEGLFFAYEDEEKLSIVDVRSRVMENFERNAEVVTKKFYEKFETEHEKFLDFIKGIQSKVDQEWYASLMLNRLMFIYFIQKKGFLDHDKGYLRNRLVTVQKKKGKNKFYSFYRNFLLVLFHKGLGSPVRDSELEAEIGKVPYLNGGLFDVHLIEHENKDIFIEDKAFERLFDFFDEFNWHLDTRITSTGKDINPDVIGYIFEKYINDRAAMGAYYTKEDITEYISKNCIIPWLFDEVKRNYPKPFAKDGIIWSMLKESGDKYIYSAVKHGIKSDLPEEQGFLDLPADVQAGLDPNMPDLVEKRKCWNRPAPDDIALPTEIYRELIARRKRYYEVRKKIEQGEITEINDFITFNLDIRQFTQDVLAGADDPKLIMEFYKAVRKITVLDLTCGSGAFLFAALNVLEPLYFTCVTRMREFVEEHGKGMHKFFEDQLALIDADEHPNEEYFIYKSIILQNLYGVDIMKEAVEIAKLRLFLKLVATVDVDYSKPNLGLEPLPDIDFNIRSGNTLVGYATLSDLDKGGQAGLFGDEEKKATIEEAELVSMAYARFKDAQLIMYTYPKQYKDAKDTLNERLSVLNEKLNKHLAVTYLGPTYSGKVYDAWLSSHQPFHWLAEFYTIIENGGFDVIIGNPPYVSYAKARSIYRIEENNYTTVGCGNLYAFISERALRLVTRVGQFGVILPLSSTNANDNSSFQTMMRQVKTLHISHFAVRPSKLFVGVDMNLTIILAGRNKGIQLTTGLNRWPSHYRPFLFHNAQYTNHEFIVKKAAFPKFGKKIEISIWNKLHQSDKRIGSFLTGAGNITLAFHGFGRYWRKCIRMKLTDNYQEFETSKETAPFAICALNSQLCYWYWIVSSDCYRFTKTDALNFPAHNNILDAAYVRLSETLLESYDINSEVQEKVARNGEIVSEKQFFPQKSKPIIDKIDHVLAKHYGFTEEELDFIINYDIKYRMGKEL